ncbi:MAG: site-specific DNA-methyltransferase, partial [Candidatus Gracilibacteria bacterium]
MHLTDNEKRDVIKYLEAGKPLPEKYRFLLFDDDREVELLWNGKTNEVTNVVLPFQVIEQIDEPRSDEKFGNAQGSLFDMTGRQISGWTNKLIWGDNKLILSSLKNGPLRKEIEAQGGLKLIYIDPPFDVGADFSINIEIGEEEFTKKPSVIEELAYRDTWGKGADSFIAMIYERLKLMHDLLADDGSIYVHCDWRMSPALRFILNEIFGIDNFQNEIYWYYYNKLHGASKNVFPRATDSILYYVKNRKNFIFNHQKEPRDKPVKKLKYHFIGGKIVNDKDENGKTITYLSTERQIDNVWRIRCLQPADKSEWLGYDTQKLKWFPLSRQFFEIFKRDFGNKFGLGFCSGVTGEDEHCCRNE